MTDGREDRMPLCGVRCSARTRGGVSGGRGWRSEWLSGLAIDRDEKAFRGGGGGGGGVEEGGGAEGKEEGYFVSGQSRAVALAALSEPNRKWEQQQHSRCFSLFLRTDANITCVSSLWRSSPHR